MAVIRVRRMIALTAVFLLHGSVVAADEERGCVYLRSGDPPLVVLKPPLERWRFDPSSGPDRPFLAVVDAEFGTRVEFWEIEASALAGRLAAEVVGTPIPERADRPFGLSGRERPIWTFEGRLQGEREAGIGVVVHEVWSVEAGSRLLSVSIRIPEAARAGPAAEATRLALEYVRASIGVPGEKGVR